MYVVTPVVFALLVDVDVNMMAFIYCLWIYVMHCNCVTGPRSDSVVKGSAVRYVS